MHLSSQCVSNFPEGADFHRLCYFYTVLVCRCRYLVVEVVPEDGRSVRMNSLQAAVLAAVKRLHGDFGVGAVTPGLGGEASAGVVTVVVVTVIMGLV